MGCGYRYEGGLYVRVELGFRGGRLRMNERISIFSNFMKWCDREGKDGMNLLWEEDFYEIGKVVMDEIVRCEILKKKFKIDKEDIIRYYKDTDWEREYLGERFYEEIKKEVER